MIAKRSFILPVIALSLIACLATLSPAAGPAASANPDFTRGGTIPAGATHDWNLGPTGARGWIYSNKMETSEARQIYVTKVEPGSPAAGVLEVGGRDPGRRGSAVHL